MTIPETLTDDAKFAEQDETVEELFREYKRTGQVELRNKIVEKYLHLAEILALKYVNRGVGYEDLYQVASWGLVVAADRYDPDKGILFTSFATPTILGEIKKYFRDSTWSLRVPRRLKEISRLIMEAVPQIQEESGRAPTVKELAKRLDVSEEEIIEGMEIRRAYVTYSLDQDTENKEDGEASHFERFLGDEEPGYDQVEISSVFEKVVEDLSPREKDVLRKRFLQEITQREVADALGISQMTVSRIERALKEKFRAEQ